MERKNNISAIRFIAMCSIVLCHIMQNQELASAYWFNVGVQIFLCISGFLYGNKEKIEYYDFIKNGFIKILTGYYIVILATSVMYRLLDSCSLNTFFNLITLNGLVDGLQHLWFVQVLLFCYLITFLLDEYFTKNKFKNKYIAFIVITLISFFIIPIYFMRFHISYVLCYIAGFFIGREERDTKNINNKLFVFFAILALILNTVKIFNIGISDITVIHNYSHMALGIFIFILLFKLFKEIRYNKALRFSDKYSYEVYLVHHLFIIGPFSLMGLTNSLIINIAVVITLTVISAILLNVVSSKIKIKNT